MRRVFTIGLFSIFSIMMAGTVMAQERQVLQEGYSGIGTGKIGSGPGGGLGGPPPNGSGPGGGGPPHH